MGCSGDTATGLFLWAKLSRSSDGSIVYHPLLCHMVDVAAVVREMWLSVLSPKARRETSLALGFGRDQEAAGLWLAFLGGLHDIGKASPGFQLCNEEVRPTFEACLKAAGLSLPRVPRKTRHGIITATVLKSLLEDGFGIPGSLASRVATAVGGHHGLFPSTGDVNTVSTSAVGASDWQALRLRLAEQLARLLLVPRDKVPGALDNTAAMQLAGLVSIADWIGSNECYFPHTPVDLLPDISVYKAEAEEQARLALKELGWSGWPASAEVKTFRESFPRIPEPNHLQRTVEGIAKGMDSAGLVIIEAPMGEGKTEAAMYLADYWSGTLGQQGHYFALPTQATSNQMFGRVQQFLSGRYESGLVNVQLLHGHASLSAEFQVLRERADRVLHLSVSDDQIEDEEERVIAAEWFTYRKRGLLAPFGVGTIDQALLSVLQTRHVFVRLFGLSHKTVILDEVHAYDAYMTTLLERLLEWLASLGTSVVLLSATLPSARRKALTEAYAKGLGADNGTSAPHKRYPRVMWLTRSHTEAESVETSGRSRKHLLIEWVDGTVPSDKSESFSLGERLKAALKDGGCVAVICNTVVRAQNVYLALKRYFPDMADDGFPELDLLHARFLFQDREKRERRALQRFGKGDRPVKRAVLVATQVIEQSLDLDFDLMVTGMSPVDLLLQRAGRLHRHVRTRPPGLEQPHLWVCRPQVDDGVPQFEQGTKAVYDHHVLLRSWLELHDRRVVRIPEDVEELIEGVYGEQECPPNLPGPLRQAWGETRKEQEHAIEAEKNEARDRWLNHPKYEGHLWRLIADPREEDSPEFHKAHQALTRLAEISVATVCLYGTPEQPYLDRERSESVDLGSAPDLALTKHLLRRSVHIPDKRAIWDLLRIPVPEGWQKSPLLRNHRPLFLSQEGSALIDSYSVVVDDNLGVVIESQRR